MKKITCLFLALTLILSCQNQKDYSEYSENTIACINSIDTSIIDILDKFENYLIEKEYLSDNSKSSYLEFIENVQNQEIEINIHNLGEYVFGNGQLAWDYFSPSKTAVFIQCLRNGKSETNDSYFYDWATKVLMKAVNDEFVNIESENDLNTGAKNISIEYSEIPEDLFENKLIHYCFLISLYQKL